MLKPKQRAFLRKMAHDLDPIFQIGKGGVGEAGSKSIADALEARELVKISVLENASEDVRDAANALAEATGAEVVAVIGRKIILYKQSSKPEKRIYSAML